VGVRIKANSPLIVASLGAHEVDNPALTERGKKLSKLSLCIIEFEGLLGFVEGLKDSHRHILDIRLGNGVPASMGEGMSNTSAHGLMVDVEELVPRGLPQRFITIPFKSSEQSSWSRGEAHRCFILTLIVPFIKTFSEEMPDFSRSKVFFRATEPQATKAREWKTLANSMRDWFSMAIA